MDIDQLQDTLLRQHNLRIERHMAEYVLQHLSADRDATIPVIGGDARTGVAVRKTISLKELNSNPPTP